LIQTGDPLTFDLGMSNLCGTRGSSFKFDNERVTIPYQRGIVAIANSGQNNNVSQYFTINDYPLDPVYSILGKVIMGMDVVDKLQVDDKILKVETLDK